MNGEYDYDVVVAGHLCIDLLPRMAHVQPESLMEAGKLFEIGALDMATGGAVSNTGLAVRQLGGRVALMAGVGDDLLGQVIRLLLEQHASGLTQTIRTIPGESSSYSIVLSPQRIDRIFLHCTGPNSTFGLDSVDMSLAGQGRIFHLGYPPLLPRMFADEGRELTAIFHSIRESDRAAGSLDMTLPDPGAPSGKANWWTILTQTMPFVDIFIPSLQEARFMLDRTMSHDTPTLAELRRLTDTLLNMGSPALVGIKLGEYGVYLRSGSAGSLARLQAKGLAQAIQPDSEVYHPAFAVEVIGTTGAGDSAYAALLLALGRGFDLTACAEMMCAVGACNVEAPDATSGVQSWDSTLARVQAGWSQSHLRLPGM